MYNNGKLLLCGGSAQTAPHLRYAVLRIYPHIYLEFISGEQKHINHLVGLRVTVVHMS